MKTTCLVILFAASTLHAQWAVVGNNLLGKYFTDYGGAITHSDGVSWAGYSSLWKSLDSGTTWIKQSFNHSPIMDIQFFNRDTGVIAVMDQGIYLTTNGGTSFVLIASMPVCLSACFGDNAQTIIGANRYSSGGYIHISHDLGKSWEQRQVEGEIGSVYYVHYHPIAKSIIALSRGITPRRRSRIHISSDNGKSWIKQAGEVDLDCYGFAVHPCKRDIIYLINEDHNEHPNGLSEVFTSYDMGTTFLQSFSRFSSSLAGVASATDRAVYVASTIIPNVLRSIDTGWTWTNIGGPELKEDSRSLFAINDDIILAADREGNIWRTTNSGGFPLAPVPNPSKIYQLRSENGINQTNRSTPAVIPIYLKRTSPLPPLEFTVSYNAIDYTHAGTFNSAGQRIDIPSQSTEGKIRVRFSSDDLVPNGDSLIGYTQLFINSYELFCDTVRFIEPRFDAYTGVCDTLPSVTGTFLTVGNYSGCGGVTLSVSDLIHYRRGFFVFPNPSTGHIRVRSYHSTPQTTVKVIDMTGRVVFENAISFEQGEQYDVDLTSLPSGVYYIRFASEDVSETYPILLIK